jgi:hypothetical protein
VLFNFLRSVAIATTISFTVPILLLAAVFAPACACIYIPGCARFGESLLELLVQFPTVFGNGSPWWGTLAIGLVCAFVGGLFDIYAFFYSYSTDRPSAVGRQL